MKSSGELFKDVFVGLGAVLQLLLLLIWFLIKLPFIIAFGILKLLFRGFGDDLKSASVNYRGIKIGGN